MRILVGALAMIANGVVQDLGAQASAFPAVVAARVPAINTGLLRLGTDQYVVFMVREGRREVLARVTDEVSFVEVAPGDTAIRRVYRWSTGEETYSHLDTLLVDRTDLSLRSYARHGAGAVSRLEWAAGRLRGEVVVNGKARPIDAWLNASVYVAGSLDLVARASLLSPEYSASFSTFSPESGTIAPAHLSVTGTDSIGVPQWRVQSDVRGLLTTYWVDRRSHRIIREARYMGTGFRVEVVPVSPVTTTSK
jgi:hypothetical protein